MAFLYLSLLISLVLKLVSLSKLISPSLQCLLVPYIDSFSSRKQPRLTYCTIIFWLCLSYCIIDFRVLSYHRVTALSCSFLSSPDCSSPSLPCAIFRPYSRTRLAWFLIQVLVHTQKRKRCIGFWVKCECTALRYKFYQIFGL